MEEDTTVDQDIQALEQEAGIEPTQPETTETTETTQDEQPEQKEEKVEAPPAATKEDIQSLKEDIKAIKEDPTKTKEEKKEEIEDLIEFFEAGWKPKDWNDFSNQFFKKATPLIYQDVRNRLEQEQTQIREAVGKLDNEYKELEKEGLVPKRDTEEGRKIDAQITLLGAQNNAKSMREAYELWAKTPVEYGGGYGREQAVEEKPDPKARSNAQKERASRASQSSGGVKPKTTGISYDKLHNARDVDELLEDENL